MREHYALTVLCATLGVSRSGYLAWASGRRSVREQRDAQLRPKLRAAFAASRQTYGSPRMTVELRAQGEAVSKGRVARLMRGEGLQGRQRRRYQPRTTQSEHAGPIALNLAAARPLSACDQVWRADITYLPTARGWLYLAVVLDAYSKRVLGWAFSTSLESSFVLAALRMALTQRGGRCAPGLLFHSDRGVQYASARFRAQLAIAGITASMSRRGNCYDNALAESFFATLKLEHTYRHYFTDHAHAQRATFEWIEAFYNRRRRHSSLGYCSPVDFENQQN
jgi:putative transposase